MKKMSFHALLQILDEMENKELKCLLERGTTPQIIKKSSKASYTKTTLTQNKI